MHLFNFKNKTFVSEGIDQSLNAKMIHWLPVSDDLIKVEVMMPDAKKIKGVAEQGVKELEVGTVIQFERFGFCRLDSKKKNKLIFWFCHK